MTRYIRELKRVIAEIISKKEGKLTTMPMYWIIDTPTENALTFIYPSKSKYRPIWLLRKLAQRGWEQAAPTININSAGRDKSVSFIQVTVRKLEASGGNAS